MKNLTKIVFAIAPLATLAASTLATAAGQSSANFIMKADAINNGVGDMTSTNFQLSSSLGDAAMTGTITSVSFRLSNGFRATVNATPAVLNLLSVISRKIHGATPFDLTIDKGQPLSGSITVEPRTNGSGHTLVFQFDGVVNSVTAVSALDQALNSAATATFALAPASQDVVVTLTNVSDNKRLTITLNGVNGSVTPVMASMGFLVGDVTSSRSVNAADISAVKANVGKSPLDNTTFKFDLNANGSITQSDVSAVKARSGLMIP